MASDAATFVDVTPGREAASAGFSVEVSRDLAALEAPWRMLEERATATPYQRFDWISGFVEAGVEEAMDPHIVLIRDGQGRPAMVLPLTVARHAGFRVAAFVGGKHANFKLPLTCRALASQMSVEQQRALLVAAGRRLRLDAFEFEHVPRIWDGEPVPLAAFGRPSPSNAYGVTLGPDGAASLKRAMSADGRRKLRNKENTIRKQGEVRFLVARETAEVDLILTAFFQQKSDRFRAQGIRDPFAGAAADFIRSASLRGLEGGRPAIELSAVTLDGRVIAAFGAAADARRISGMFISFDPEVSRYSPGDQLVARVIADSADRGRTFFDLGVGEAEYKRRFCHEVEEVVDVLLPVSARGRIYVAARRAAVDLKRRIKQSDNAMNAVKALRRARARVGF